MITLREIFDRAAILALRGGLPFTEDKSLATPIEDIREYLSLGRDGFRRKPYFGIRIDYSMRVNFNNRPAVSLGFESRPEQKLVRKVQTDSEDFIGRSFGKIKNYVDEAFSRGGEQEPEIFHASQAVVVTDYRKAINRHGFAVMVYDRMTDYKADLPVVFGMTAKYDKIGNCNIRRLSVPEFGEQGSKGLRDIPVTRENIILALKYGQLCADQVYQREQITPRRNWELAQKALVQANIPIQKPVG